MKHTDSVTIAPCGLILQLDRSERRVTARGELDNANASALAEVLATLLDANPGDSTVDLGALTFIDAAGLGCLVVFSNKLDALGATLRVTGAKPRLCRLFDIVGLSSLLEGS